MGIHHSAGGQVAAVLIRLELGYQHCDVVMTAALIGQFNQLVAGLLWVSVGQGDLLYLGVTNQTGQAIGGVNEHIIILQRKGLAIDPE